MYCDWLTPLHVAKLPLLVYEPLTFVVMEQAAGDHAYLHLTLTNTCPLPVAIKAPSLTTDDLSLTQLHGELPKVPVVIYGTSLGIEYKYFKLESISCLY